MIHNTQFTTVASQIVDGFDNGAHRAIGAWREGGERLGVAARQRWNSALKQSSPELSAETRRNATHAQKVFAGYYNKGLGLSTSGAEVAVDTLVEVARKAIDRAAEFKASRA